VKRTAAVVWVLLAVLAGGCAHDPPRFDPARRPTILVLSVGGPDGVAHLGAVQAVRDARLPVAAVVGNSMGALVGALYASAPQADTAARWQLLLDRYERATTRAKLVSGVALGVAFGAVAAAASDGELLPTVGAAAGGLLLGAAATSDLDQRRLVRAMNGVFAGARVESTPIRFVTFHHRVRGSGVELAAVTSGDLAEAVGASLANPLLFADVDVRAGAPLDPGADRAAAVPVEDACRLFPGSNILAINVTGRPAFYSAAMTCPLREVRLAPAGLGPQELRRPGPRFQQVVAAARAATGQALAAGR